MHDSVLVPLEQIESKIYFIRGRKVMLDRDLAELYGVKTHVLNQAVKRNIERFPEDFMFELSLTEEKNLISQFVISSWKHGGYRKLPHAFTEQGVAMLSCVLKSERAVKVSIQIMRVFTKLRELLADNDFLRHKVEALEKQYDENFKVVFDALRGLLASTDEPKEEIGFKDASV